MGSAILCAAAAGHVSAIREILGSDFVREKPYLAKASLLYRDETDATALHRAAESGQTNVLEFYVKNEYGLVEAEFWYSVTKANETAAHKAVKKEHISVRGRFLSIHRYLNWNRYSKSRMRAFAIRAALC